MVYSKYKRTFILRCVYTEVIWNKYNMKTIIFTTFLIIVTQISFAQVEVRLEGDVNDSTFLATVEKMKAAGFTVIVNEEDPFIARHTDNELPAFDLTDLNGNRIKSKEHKRSEQRVTTEEM